MNELLTPLADISTFEAQTSRQSVKFSTLFKKTLKLQFLLRRRTRSYLLLYIVGLSFSFFFLFLSYIPTTSTEDDRNPKPISQANQLFYTRKLFSLNSTFLYITSKSNQTATYISENMFNTRNYKILPNINEISQKVVKANYTTTLFGLDVNIDPQLSQLSTKTSYLNSISFTTITSLISTYSGISFLSSLFEYFNNKYLPNMTIPLSYRYYAHPQSTLTISAQYVAIIYFIMGHIFVVLSSTVIYFTLNFNKSLFLLEINGVTSKVRFYVNLVTMIIEHLPIDIISTVLFCFLAPITKGTNFFLFFVSDYLFTLSLFSIQIFFQPLLHSKGSSSAFSTILILFIVLFEYFILFQQYIPKTVYQIILCLFSPASFIGMSNLMIQRKNDIGPMSWNSLDYKFNNVSGYFTLAAQAISTLLYIILALLGNICNRNCYGQPPLGWPNIFRIGAWKRMFSKSARKPLISHRRSNLTKTASEMVNYTEDSLMNLEHEFDTTKNILEFDGLCKVYKTRKSEVTALKSVSLKIDQGEFIVIFGSNGSGKTTLLSSAIGSIGADRGSIFFYGEPLLNDFDEILYPELGVVFQDNVLFDGLTVEEHFDIFGGLSGFSQSQIQSDMANFLTVLKMADMKHTTAADLSGGSKRKLCVSLSLLKKPSIVVLDEPTAGVDAQSRQLIWKVVNDFTGATVLTACHSVEECESISTRLLLMSRGSVAFVGTAAELRERYNCCYFVTVVEGDGVDMQEVARCAQEARKDAGRVRVSQEHPRTLMVPNDLEFADVLCRLEENKERLGIRKYTVQVENLEETMRKIIEDEEAMLQTA